jgi:hypothetical protein
MLTLLIGIAVLVLVLFAARSFADADPARLSKQLRIAGGVAALGAAGYLTLTGRFYAALPLGFLAFSLFDWWRMPAGFGARTKRSSNQTSRVRSAFVEMELDHDTGAMRGRILAGQYEGVPLETLDRATLVSLLGGIDAESRALLEAYLDRREAGWRENVEEDGSAGSREPPRSGAMTEEEAYQILGLAPGASAADVRRAHRTLMKRLHPDQGGSTYLAARVNAAKETLLRRHH